ncbi:hypothetical protein [Actinomadura chokoriensis]|uniref:hypothetical protein n=1 Tax=Actinomadura chokoriensis TaxID=454156 RepID=UPI0031F936E5
MPQDELDIRAGVTAARDEAARAIDRLDTARRRAARTRGGRAGPDAGADAGAPDLDRPVQEQPAREQEVAEAARALADAARELTRLVRGYGPGPPVRPARRSPPAGAAPPPAGERSDGQPLVTLDLAHRIAPGWRLYQFTLADRDAHRWHLRHDGHAAGTVTHVLDLRGRRTGWEARDARGFRLRLRPGPGPEAYRLAAPHLWATRVAAVRAAARAHRCP